MATLRIFGLITTLAMTLGFLADVLIAPALVTSRLVIERRFLPNAPASPDQSSSFARRI
jgi:hypothetical protein